MSNYISLHFFYIFLGTSDNVILLILLIVLIFSLLISLESHINFNVSFLNKVRSNIGDLSFGCTPNDVFNINAFA